MSEMSSTQLKGFRAHHLVRLWGFNHPALDDKLARIDCDFRDPSVLHVVFLDDSACPPAPLVPPKLMRVKPEHMRHACEYCLVAPTERKLMLCGKCKTAQYCNSECQLADWARHWEQDCHSFGNFRGLTKPLPHACTTGDIAEVRRLVEEEGADVDYSHSSAPTPLCGAASRLCGTWWSRAQTLRKLPTTIGHRF
jgi:MYND finger